MAVDKKKFKSQASKANMSEDSFYLNNLWQNALQALSASADSRLKFWTKSAKSYTTVGGASSEEFAAKCKASDSCFVQVKSVGASPVTVVAARCELGKVVVDFSADPADDHVLQIVII